MITIVNVTPMRAENDPPICTYELRVNGEPLARFTHRRSDGLGLCLKKAADAYGHGRCFKSASAEEVPQ